MFAEVIIPVPLADCYTYSVPADMENSVSAGVLVRVPFGKTKEFTGIVAKVMDNPPNFDGEIKPVMAVESNGPVALEIQMDLWRWIAEYYLTSVGTVFQAAFPAVLKEKRKKAAANRKQANKVCAIKDLNVLNEFQSKAYSDIRNLFLEKDVCLLNGVTASGKTEIYCHLIENSLSENRQALLLMPEIALTSQIMSRLKGFFGERLVVYHSRVSERERADLWKRMVDSGEPLVVLGVRSSVFLPFRNLGLVIVDEEHEPSYKQQEPAPRYNAKNVAIILARLHRAKVLFGSATPSLDSYYNAQCGKFGYAVLDKRFESTEQPDIIPVNVKELRRKKLMKSIFSPILIEKMNVALEKGGQILLFQNRRGFSPAVTCKVCDWTPRCKFCDISLSYHKHLSRLSCHYCGRVFKMPDKCPDCGNNDLQYSGFGTEKVEEEIRKLFPDASVDRMDSDTAKNKRSTEEIIARFENGETQILIGTQMISKGLDFAGVSLAGILNADSLMNQPDFRAYERTFQLIEQVAGRTGRRKVRGEIVLQSSRPDDPLIQAAISHNYYAMAEMQFEERKMFRYPPFYRIIRIDLKHRNESTVKDAANLLADILRRKLGDRVTGPDKPPTGKIRNYFIRRMLLKIENSAPVAPVRGIIIAAHAELVKNITFRYVSVIFDVDPVS
ncbi:MAG: primosomal protein N' [Dysgonamonadaceae bacterium]|jgi:primosomal protein N' (replication factor Y)|nr:primosomal protein N' [Dysgonamonadaceae bacterium]